MKRAMSLAIAIWGVLSFLPLRADVLVPQPHYKAMPHAVWQAQKFNVFLEKLGEIAFYIVLAACVVLMVWSIVQGIRKRRYKRMFVWLLIALSGPVLILSFWPYGVKQAATVAPIADYDVIVSPELFESYEEYLRRVDCQERHICLKCNAQMQSGWHERYCPECEPDSFFTCWKCGGAKIDALWRKKDLALEFTNAESVLQSRGLDVSPVIRLNDWYFSNDKRNCDILASKHLGLGVSRKYCVCEKRYSTVIKWEFIRAYGGKDLQSIYNLKQLYEIAREKYEYAKDIGFENIFKGINELVRLESVFTIIHSDKWRTRGAYFKGWNLIQGYTQTMKAMTDEKDLAKKDEMMSDLRMKLSRLLSRDMEKR